MFPRTLSGLLSQVISQRRWECELQAWSAPSSSVGRAFSVSSHCPKFFSLTPRPPSILSSTYPNTGHLSLLAAR